MEINLCQKAVLIYSSVFLAKEHFLFIEKNQGTPPTKNVFKKIKLCGLY